MKLMLAEDETAMADALLDILSFHGYAVDVVHDGEDALSYALSEQYDGLILDIMMPKRDGLEVLKQLRARGVRTPVLLLTAKGQVEDRIRGLDSGADDYLPKPFVMGELLARVRAMLRRREEFTPDRLQCGDLSLDRDARELSGPDGPIPLSRLEYLLMELFLLNPGTCFSTDRLLERVWGYDTEAEAGTVWVYISNLRKKLTATGSGVRLLSRRGVGYYLEAAK